MNLGLLNDLVEVVLVGLASDDIDDLVEGGLRVLLLVLSQILAQYAVVTNL